VDLVETNIIMSTRIFHKRIIFKLADRIVLGRDQIHEFFHEFKYIFSETEIRIGRDQFHEFVHDVFILFFEIE